MLRMKHVVRVLVVDALSLRPPKGTLKAIEKEKNPTKIETRRDLWMKIENIVECLFSYMHLTIVNNDNIDNISIEKMEKRIKARETFSKLYLNYSWNSKRSIWWEIFVLWEVEWKQKRERKKCGCWDGSTRKSESRRNILIKYRRMEDGRKEGKIMESDVKDEAHPINMKMCYSWWLWIVLWLFQHFHGDPILPFPFSHFLFSSDYLQFERRMHSINKRNNKSHFRSFFLPSFERFWMLTMCTIPFFPFVIFIYLFITFIPIFSIRKIQFYLS